MIQVRMSAICALVRKGGPSCGIRGEIVPSVRRMIMEFAGSFGLM